MGDGRGEKGETDREVERDRDRNKQAETKRETNPNRKTKTQYLEDNLVIIKNPKGRACMSIVLYRG